mmetsp:Transcript_31539/g.66336  ORF Transcript_31539/g.66336 Transcript_31539/m.66336 type:complete len:210 (+) Transcript_31539:255-884(+)
MWRVLKGWFAIGSYSYVSCLTLVDDACWGPGLEVIIIRGSLSSLHINNNRFDTIRSLVSTVGRLKSSGILGTDGSEDSIRLLNGSSLLSLSCNSTRVVQDKGILFSGNSSEVSRVHGSFKASNALSVDTLGTAPGGSGPGTISGGQVGKSGKDGGSGSNLSGDGTTVHVQGRGGGGDRGRGEGGSRGGEGGNEGKRKIHLDVVWCCKIA